MQWLYVDKKNQKLNRRHKFCSQKNLAALIAIKPVEIVFRQTIDKIKYFDRNYVTA